MNAASIQWSCIFMIGSKKNNNSTYHIVATIPIAVPIPIKSRPVCILRNDNKRNHILNVIVVITLGSKEQPKPSTNCINHNSAIAIGPYQWPVLTTLDTNTNNSNKTGNENPLTREMINPPINPRTTGNSLDRTSILPPLPEIVIEPLCCFLTRSKLTRCYHLSKTPPSDRQAQVLQTIPPTACQRATVER